MNNTNQITQPKAILFDWDNTIADSWDVIHNSLQKTFTDMGVTPWTMEETKDRVHKSLRDSFPIIFGEKAEIAGEKYLQYFRSTHLQNLKMLKDADKVLEKLNKTDIYLAIVSNKTGVSLRKEVRGLGFDEYFSKVIGAKDAANDKPSIDPVKMALEGKDIEVGQHVWFVGDSVSDLECAKNGNMKAVFFGEDDLSKDKYNDLQPDLHFKNHQDLLYAIKHFC